MTLTLEEEEIITISDEGRREELESCALSLIGKFLTCKSFNKKVALGALKKVWGLEDEVQVVEVGSNLFSSSLDSNSSWTESILEAYGVLIIKPCC